MDGLSILIPIFNFSPLSLFQELSIQAQQIDFPIEIICFDDCSTEIHFSNKNVEYCSSLNNVQYKILDVNVGRSRIRNLLAREAKYSYLLYIDGDSEVASSLFLQNYIKSITDADLIIGGTLYKDSHPKEATLRWNYGKERESVCANDRNKKPFHSFTLNNLLIKKNVFEGTLLNENITSYGHEDTLLGLQLAKNNCSIIHIDNGIYHVGLESNDVFLNKTIEAVRNLKVLDKEYNLGNEIRLIAFCNKLTLILPQKLIVIMLGVFIKNILKNLKSNKPKIKLMDLLKIYYFLKD